MGALEFSAILIIMILAGAVVLSGLAFFVLMVYALGAAVYLWVSKKKS